MTSWSLIGHESATAALQSALAAGRLAQAYLIIGPTGIGKGTLALWLAAALNCPEPDAPCGTCSQCRRIREGIHPDVTDLSLEEGKREISVDRIPELQHDLYLRPFEGKCRVGIIRDAQYLNVYSGNALLKILEEPPPESVLILATPDEESMLPTLRSRCQRIALQPVPLRQIEEALQRDHGLDPTDAARVATFSQGCPGIAIQAAQDGKLLEQTAEQIGILKSLLATSVAERLVLSGKLAPQEAGRDKLADELRVWTLWWRDLLLVQNNCKDQVVYVDEMDAYRDFSARLTPSEVHRALQALQDALRQLAQNANPRLSLDVLFLHLPSTAAAAAR